MLCTIGTLSLENAAEKLFSYYSDWIHYWKCGAEWDKFPWASYPGSQAKWETIQRDVDEIASTLESQYQACLFMNVVLNSPFSKGSTVWDPLKGNTTKSAQVDWYKRHQELLQRDPLEESPLNGGVRLEYEWLHRGVVVAFQVAVRLIYPYPSKNGSVFIVDIFNRKAMPKDAVKKLAVRANKHGASLQGLRGGAAQFECHDPGAHAPKAVSNPWRPPLPNPPSPESTVYSVTVSSTMNSSPSATSAPATSCVGGSTLSNPPRGIHAPEPVLNSYFPSYPWTARYSRNRRGNAL